MLTQKKGKHVRLYILEEDEPLLEKLAAATGLTQTMVLTVVVSAGIKACAADGDRLPLPLKFKIEEPKPKKGDR
jgi:hypothetical protein